MHHSLNTKVILTRANTMTKLTQFFERFWLPMTYFRDLQTYVIAASNVFNFLNKCVQTFLCYAENVQANIAKHSSWIVK